MMLAAKVRCFWGGAPTSAFARWFMEARHGRAAADSVWWTFDLESHETVEDIERSLTQAVTLVCSRSPQQLPAVEPASYPAWLPSQVR